MATTDQSKQSVAKFSLTYNSHDILQLQTANAQVLHQRDNGCNSLPYSQQHLFQSDI